MELSAAGTEEHWGVLSRGITRSDLFWKAGTSRMRLDGKGDLTGVREAQIKIIQQSPGWCGSVG